MKKSLNKSSEKISFQNEPVLSYNSREFNSESKQSRFDEEMHKINKELKPSSLYNNTNTITNPSLNFTYSPNNHYNQKKDSSNVKDLIDQYHEISR